MDNIELLESYNSYLQEQKANGKKIIAYLTHDNVPIELFEAAGFVPLPLIFAGKDELMDASHSYLPPSTCSYAQSCIGYFSSTPRTHEFLDLADYILLSNHCVSNICVSEILSNNFNRKRLDFYVSYTRNSNALKYYKLELKHLQKEIEGITKERIPDHRIKEEIIRHNNFKTIVEQVSKLNIPGSEKLDIYQKAILYGPAIQAEIEEIISSYKSNTKNTNSTHPKNVIFTGCSIFINDYLMDLIEDAGGNIVLFDTWIGRNYYSQTFSEEVIASLNDPIDLLTKRFENNVYGDHCVPDSLDNKIVFLENYVNEYHKKYGDKIGVINHIIKFCDHFSLFQSYFKEKLQERGVQVLNLERDYSRSIKGQLSTRIEAFMEMI